MEEEVLARIDKKLDAIVRMLASRCIEGMTKKTEAIIALGALGLDPNVIAQIVDTTPATVYARLAEVKRKGKAEPKTAKKEASNA